MTVEASDELLEALSNDPEWKRDALCREPEVTANFFPSRGESNDPAKAVCAKCLVNEPCLQYALDEEIVHGIWAGTSARQRSRMRGGR